jgi:four helix bundle protein
LACAGNLAQLSARWDKRHAEVDQLLRAPERVALNIAEGNGRRMGADRGKSFESAESSATQVNAYLQLSQRTGEMSVEAGRCGLELVDRVGILVRGLVEHT